MSAATKTYSRKQRLAVVGAAGLMSLAISFSLTPAFAGLVASITNSTNTANTGTLVMQEKNGAGTVTCNSNDGAAATTNTATCATINKYGGTTTGLIPGGAGNTTSITITNTGSVAATGFTVKGGTCTQSAVAGASFTGTATDLCSKINVTIKSGATTIFTGTAAAFSSAAATDILAAMGTTSVAPAGAVPLTITVALDASAGPTYQGLQVSQPITWSFTA